MCVGIVLWGQEERAELEHKSCSSHWLSMSSLAGTRTPPGATKLWTALRLGSLGFQATRL